MRYKKNLLLFITTFFFYVNSANATITNWQESENNSTRTRLLASFYQDKDGQKKLIVGLQFKISKGWKIYGNDSSGIGLPPSLSFDGSTNYQKHQVIWPQATEEQETIGSNILKYSTYRDEVILPIEITFKEAGKEAGKESDKKTELNLKVNYGLCKDVCIPAEENFSLIVSNSDDKKALDLIQKFYPNKISDRISKSSKPKTQNRTSTTLISAIILALIGGAILNIMPCVLPVLSIKLLSVINHSEAKISRIRLAFFATITGIISCFFTLAIIAVAIKITGSSLGWGLQFQNPYFLTFMIVVLILLSGNLLGIFEINFDQFLANLLNKKISQKENQKNIVIPNFLSGILAVLLATPCSAPFLGSAISFALTQNLIFIFAIFIAIGLGFSLPYIILLISPKLVYLLPKPGNWMFRIKKLMAAFLIITAIWLTYALAHNIGVIQSLIAFCLAILLLFSLEMKSYFMKFFIIISLTITVFYLPTSLQQESSYKEESVISNNDLWLEFDEGLLHYLVSQGNTVIVDVTADWCLTCKLNKVRVLKNDEVINKLKSTTIVGMRADITKPNEEVMSFLRKHDRFAIPFNAVYGPNAKNGLLTSEFLGKQELLDLIKKAEN